MEQQSLKSNIWKFAIILITNKRIFAAILAAYYLTIPDVTAQTIGFILLAGNIAGFLLEIPSGYVSDKLGHKEAMVLSKILLIVSTLFFLFAEETSFLVLGAIFLSFGQSFMSGTGAAFMHETLRGLGRENDYTRVMGKVSSIGFAVPIVLTVLIPFLIGISFKAPFIVALVSDIIGLIFATALVKPKVSQEQVDEIGVTNFKQVIQAGYKLGFFKYALFMSVIAGLLFSVGIFRAPYQLVLGVPVIYFGVLFGIGRALASLLLAYSGKIKDFFSDILSLYKFQIILYGGLITLMGLTENVLAILIIFIILNGFQWGFRQVNLGFMLEIINDSKFKATLLSTQQQINLIIQGVTSALLGIIITQTSYSFAFLCLGISLLVLSTPIYLFIKSKHKAAGVS